MYGRLSQALVVCLTTALMIPVCASSNNEAINTTVERKVVETVAVEEVIETVAVEEPVKKLNVVKAQEFKAVVATAKEVESEIPEEPQVEEIVEETIDIPQVSEEEMRLIALVTMAEAEGEPEEGKRLVIDTILNRVDSEHFPDTITEVIYQKNQFSSMWNGRVNRCYVMDDIYQLVQEEIKSRSNYEVIFFTAGKYGAYGNPMFQVGHHYFASYD